MFLIPITFHPDAMATHLSAMPKSNLFPFVSNPPKLSLTGLTHRRPPQALLTRVVLPALTSFYFHGVNEYAEDIVSQIHVPPHNNDPCDIL